MPVSTQQAPTQAAQIVQLIVFRIGDEEFGVRIEEVREIIATGPITPIPDSPDFIKGVINVRGEVPIVIDLKERFFLHTKEAQSKHVVLTEQEKNLFGLLVDEVTEVLRIPANLIKKAPELVTKIHEDYVSGVITIENRLIILLDLAKVLSEEDLEKLTEVQRSHRMPTGHAVEPVREKIAQTSIKSLPHRDVMAEPTSAKSQAIKPKQSPKQPPNRRK